MFYLLLFPTLGVVPMSYKAAFAFFSLLFGSGPGVLHIY